MYGKVMSGFIARVSRHCKDMYAHPHLGILYVRYFLIINIIHYE